MSNGWKLFLMAASGLITCLVISTGIIMARQANEMGVMASEKLTSFQTSIKEEEMMQYQGATVMGSDVINLLKSTFGGYCAGEIPSITITVVTKAAETVHHNNDLLDEITKFDQPAYIRPTAQFSGTVLRNENNVITGLRFEQTGENL